MKERAAMFFAGAALAMVTVVSAASAQPRGQRNGGGPGGGGPGGTGRPHCPPAVAFEACSGAGDGDACSFAGRQGEEVSGTCAALDDGSAVCVPEGAPAPGSHESGEN